MSQNKKPLPEKWQQSADAMKATQVAFDLDERIQTAIRTKAVEDGLSPSDCIRSILSLPISKRPKRPRLTASFNEVDYVALAERYQVESSDKLEIKRRVMQDLIHYVEHNTK